MFDICCDMKRLNPHQIWKCLMMWNIKSHKTFPKFSLIQLKNIQKIKNMICEHENDGNNFLKKFIQFSFSSCINILIISDSFNSIFNKNNMFFYDQCKVILK